MLDGAIRSGRLKGFRINNRCPTVSASLFTDDTIIFAQASLLEAHRLNILLGQCMRATSQKVDGVLKQDIKEVFGMRDLGCGEKYLGLPSE